MSTFRHEALFYAGEDDFLAAALPFLTEGAERGENALVAVSRARADVLRCELGDAADFVRFVDMAELGRNPARIIPAWQDFVARRGGDDERLRGIGEPIWAGRSEGELDECHKHEALLNLAFADVERFWLVCPYDVDSLPDHVLEAARGTHPRVNEDGHSHQSAGYLPPSRAPGPFEGELSPPVYPLDEIIFAKSDLRDVRRFVEDRCAAARVEPAVTMDMVLAVNELATNSVLHGGGRGILRSWRANGSVVWEIRDSGRLERPLLGREIPSEAAANGRGLWLANQVCDLVQMRSDDDGSTVRVQVRAGH
jgi:anti-sigma regulatory factor (Ser/Thr protein kinase)